MSGRSSREKGRRAEIALCKLLTDELGIEVKRNVDQARAGGADCLMVPGYAIECKRTEALSRPKWWAQACRQAAIHRVEPLVMYRQSRKEWRALVVSDFGGFKDVSLAEALDMIREKLTRLYGMYGGTA